MTDRATFSKLCFLAAFVLALIATLAVGGIITAALPWAVPAAVTAIAVGWLVA